jgi:endonuclease YncB( thermonuclease family)
MYFPDGLSYSLAAVTDVVGRAFNKALVADGLIWVASQVHLEDDMHVD